MLAIAPHRPGHDEKNTYFNGLGRFLCGKSRAANQKNRKKAHNNSQFPSSVDHVYSPFRMWFLKYLPTKNTIYPFYKEGTL
jgi:hypothetical protein